MHNSVTDLPGYQYGIIATEEDPMKTILVEVDCILHEICTYLGSDTSFCCSADNQDAINTTQKALQMYTGPKCSYGRS